MMQREDWLAAVMELGVADTHCHLKPEQLNARDFWDIAEYFWFVRQLWAAGYPRNAKTLEEPIRRTAFWKSYQKCRNTVWCWAFDKILLDLYGVSLTCEADIEKTDVLIRERSQDIAWTQELNERCRIRCSVVNEKEHTVYPGLDGVCKTVPRIDEKLGEWLTNISNARDFDSGLQKAKADIDAWIANIAKQQFPGFMTKVPQFSGNTWDNPAAFAPSRDRAIIEVLHRLSANAQRYGLFFQMFLGVESGWCGSDIPQVDPDRITKLYGLFETYHCQFDLITANDANNIDIVHAANVCANVHAGGLWWYNFRPSSYRQAMAYRLEGMPACKSAIVATDAYYLEWCYGKISVIKTTLAEFLHQQTQAGWVSEKTALDLACHWLYESAAQLLQVK